MTSLVLTDLVVSHCVYRQSPDFTIYSVRSAYLEEGSLHLAGTVGRGMLENDSEGMGMGFFASGMLTFSDRMGHCSNFRKPYSIKVIHSIDFLMCTQQ